MDSRRRFLGRGFAALLLLPLARAAGALAAMAESCPQGAPASEAVAARLIDERNKKRVDYYANWADAKDHEKFVEGATCDNCSFYKPHRAEPVFGRCTMAAMRYVPSCGWCKLHKFVKGKGPAA